MRSRAARSGICLALILLGPLTSPGQLRILPAGSPPDDSSIALGWNPSPSTNVAGYQIRWGFVTGQCTNGLAAGNVTNATIGGLETNTWYFFTVVATNETGATSDPSNEIAWSIPSGTIPLAGTGNPPGIYQFSTTVSFAGANGANPYAPLVAGNDGNFYGTTAGGGNGASGTNGAGTIFRFSSSGSLAAICYLDDLTGKNPLAPLVLGSDGFFYGTASSGSVGSGGSAFQVSSDGQLGFVPFSSSAGMNPAACLVQSASADFFGTTTTDGPGGAGTVFRGNSAGVLTTVVGFNGSNGAQPRGPLLQVADGTFYGTTFAGGANNLGTIFRISPAGTLTTLFHFSGARDGAYPVCGLLLGRDGQLYGTTSSGGGSNCGTVFRIGPSGAFSVLYAFSGGTDGANPCAGLIQGSDGSLLGTTVAGGVRTNGFPMGCGTVFRIDTNGGFSTVYRFGGQDGANPHAPLFEATNGIFYGTTVNGGTFQLGSIFRLKYLIQAVARALCRTGNGLTISWSVAPSARYQLQYNAGPDAASWINLGAPMFGTNSVLTTTDTINPGAQRFYRLLLLAP